MVDVFQIDERMEQILFYLLDTGPVYSDGCLFVSL
jgi:hypothetical protein